MNPANILTTSRFLLSFVIVYLIVVAMAVRLKARFPQGEQLIEESAVSVDPPEAPGSAEDAA